MHKSLLTLVLLLSTTLGAMAADEVIEAPAEVDAARFSWTGPYAGLSVGYAWLKDVDYAPPAPLVGPFYDQGEDWNVGGYVGILYQFSNNLVVGAEIEATRLDIDYEALSFITVEHAITPKLRVGYAYDRFLVSGNIGGVYAKTNFAGLADWGLAAGIGVDYALTDNITAGLQYSHYRFEEFDGTQIDARINAIAARVGYKF